ncbi:methyltransferase domain-containing protein [Rhizobium sp. CG5]|uniref:class I SAM-dependent DNA methyltransferase n=1 Tax=Rhizobium sp. CG5 TaxID=2726076 RepID=UPI002033C92B|nr:methyltransferase domain-containing protein [Rhizobium sp. CG5]MCM2472718.1 methyltransferase domain-containing protein [Rhizobium sp. CG5]
MRHDQLSSGDATADRRADYARMLDEGGDPAAAAELMEQALDLAPGWPAGWFQLSQYRSGANNVAGAANALQTLLELDPDDLFGARLKLALLGVAAVPAAPSSRYVEALFDEYADHFDVSLVEKLDYCIPEKLTALLKRIDSADRRYDLAVDLGCGTGLLGIEIRDRVDRLEGFDLSANMLAKAEEKEIYDLLAQADLSLGPDACGLFADGLARHRADLVAAADVMMYLGSLDTVLLLAAELIAPSGILAFSVEEPDEAGGYILAESMRYQHSESYIRTQLAEFGFQCLATEKTAIRKDGAKRIPGILFIARRTG